MSSRGLRGGGCTSPSHFSGSLTETMPSELRNGAEWRENIPLRSDGGAHQPEWWQDGQANDSKLLATSRSRYQQTPAMWPVRLSGSLRHTSPCSFHSGRGEALISCSGPCHLAKERNDWFLPGDHQRNSFFHSLSSRTMIMTKMDTFLRKNLKRLLRVFHFPSAWWTKTGEGLCVEIMWLKPFGKNSSWACH